MRIRSRFVAALSVVALALGGVAVTTSTASAAAPGPTLTIETATLWEEGLFNQYVMFSGSGWKPGSTVIVDLERRTPDTRMILSRKSPGVMADRDGNIAGWLYVAKTLEPTFGTGVTYLYLAHEDSLPWVKPRISNVVPLHVYPKPGTASFDLDVDTFTDGDAEWGGGIDFTSGGWTPGATVRIGVNRYATATSGDTDFASWVADENGRITGTWHPTLLVPQLPDESGAYPGFVFEGVEWHPDGYPVAKAAHELVITPAGSMPSITVSDTTYEAGDATWGGGIGFTGSGFAPGASVTVVVELHLSASHGDGWSADFVADGEGNLSGILTPDEYMVPRLPDSTEYPGYPQYSVRALERDNGMIVRYTDRVQLTITEPPAVADRN